ncbi:flagellar filament capping protein FliD [Thermovenabulum gondwanense]|uniref:Flagellar hook-associated protein 2 n=1 Tax=Thermovenabulum gondwanense TaxID=520767 RepID=A0A161PV26_9FIRM|nr:flagellar filament capping protein FliD [Thermovenabulum gondwanense]KYO64101.1 Flagellar hook-associated protein 2 [Thermovenabulum gondwanense]
MVDSISRTLRIGGLASGMDIDKIVSDLMKIERQKVDKLYQQKQILEWQREDYRNINLKIKALYDSAFNMKLQGTYLKYKATVSYDDGTAPDSIFTATPGASAMPGTYEVEVQTIAKEAIVYSQEPISKSQDSKINIYAKLRDEVSKFENNPFENDIYTISFTINGEEFNYDFSDSGAHKDYTLNDILNDINKRTNAKVKAYYDVISDKVVIKSRETGSSASVNIVNVSGNLFGDSSALKIKEENKLGQDATISIKNLDIAGEPITITRPTNTFTIGGIQFNLKKEAPGKTATLTIERDVDTVVETIKNFINTYNDTISSINSKLTEERYRDYLPLTDEQKKELKEDEIKKWEEKARSGLLRGDTVLSGLVNKLRQAVYERVEGQPSDFDTLFDVGVKTGGYYEKGKLYLDEAKLKEAISKNPEAVAGLFTKVVSSIYDIAKSGMDSITKKAGSSNQYFDNSLIAQNIRSLNDRISKMEEDLKKVEDRYWKQFTEMEKAIQSMNQQSMWLASQLGLYQSQ